jgi:predicted nucleic acid-binding protein
VTAVADSSPLVILTKVGCLDFLNRVFPRVYISNEVHYEVVVAGAGLPGASEVSKAEWIEVKSIQNPASLLSAQRKYGLGPGEMSAIFLAKELGASPVLLDDYRARKLAKAEGLEILGSVGLLETFYFRHPAWLGFDFQGPAEEAVIAVQASIRADKNSGHQGFKNSFCS